METIIDLSDEHQCPNVLLFNDVERDKVTGTGLQFRSYNGLRMYLITGKKHTFYLNSPTNYINDFDHPNKKWEFVPDLYKQLEDALRINLAKCPLLKLKVNKHTKFIWTKPGITPSEEEWLDIVRTVAKTMW